MSVALRATDAPPLLPTCRLPLDSPHRVLFLLVGSGRCFCAPSRGGLESEPRYRRLAANRAIRLLGFFTAGKPNQLGLATLLVNPAMGFDSSLGRSDTVSLFTAMCNRSPSSGVPRIAGTASGSHPLMGFYGNGQMEVRSVDIDTDTDVAIDAI